MCNPGKPCGNGHVYVIQLVYKGPKKGFLYVGKTGKSVEERVQDNFTRKDGTIVPIDQVKEIGEDKLWKYNAPSSKMIRSSYKRLRPDIEYFRRNPIMRGTDDWRLDEAEVQLAEDLRKRDWIVKQA